MSRKMKTVLLALAVITVLTAGDALAGDGFKVIRTAQLHAMVVHNAYELEGGRESPFVIIDVRSKQEYARAHIVSAISIPVDGYGHSAALLPKDKTAHFVVYGNHARSHALRAWVTKAAAMGYTNLLVYAEGFKFWKAQQFPVAP